MLKFLNIIEANVLQDWLQLLTRAIAVMLVAREISVENPLHSKYDYDYRVGSVVPEIRVTIIST